MRIRQLKKRQWNRNKGNFSLHGSTEVMTKDGVIIYLPLLGDRPETERRKEISVCLTQKPLLPPDSLVWYL